MEWQPIETAPQGAAIVYDREIGVIPNGYIFSPDGRASYGYYNNTAYNVTHWMPLPPPPTEGAG
jgi:sugar lactone lactonase YvrE